jgi:acyl-CoA synthetase (AMP-forming)/AMP-acid ligase II
MKTDWLEKLCLYYPQKVAMKEVETERTLTYQEFQNCANHVASIFTDELGLKRGERVAILAENSLEHFLLKHGQPARQTQRALPFATSRSIKLRLLRLHRKAFIK